MNKKILIEQFHDGKTEKIKLNAKGFKDIDTIIIASLLKLNTTLKTLNISSWSILKGDLFGDIGVFKIVKALRINSTLTELNLSGDKITVDGAKNIGNELKINKTLKKFTMNSEIPLELFRGGHKILDLSSKGYNDKDIIIIAILFEVITVLTSLNLSKNKIGDTGAQVIGQKLTGNLPLTELNLFGNFISDDGAWDISKGLKTNRKLKILTMTKEIQLKKLRDEQREKLDLSSKAYADIDIIIIATLLKHQTVLHTLNLSKNKITKTGAKAIYQFLKHNNVLISLNLSNNKIGDTGTQVIVEGLRGQNAVIALDLSKNKITDLGAQSIGIFLKTNSKLEKLIISYNLIDDKGAETIAQGLKDNNTLILLDLSNNKIGDTGACTINKSLKKNNPCQVTLDLSNNKIRNKTFQDIITSWKG